MSEKEEIDCDYTDGIICPYCGYDGHSEGAWEIDFGPTIEGDTELECMNEHCEKIFHVERHAPITYSTKETDHD